VPIFKLTAPNTCVLQCVQKDQRLDVTSENMLRSGNHFSFHSINVHEETFFIMSLSMWRQSHADFLLLALPVYESVLIMLY
jgi:hypothetical protein